MSIAAGLGVIGFVGAAQWNSSIARQEFITSAQRVLITQAEQAQREQERLRSEIEDAEARVQSFQEADVGSQAAREELNEQLATARLKTGLTAVVDTAFDAGGALYILEVASGQSGPPPFNPGLGIGRLLRKCPGANPPAVLLTGLFFPSGVAVGPDGAVYLSNMGVSTTAGEVLRLAVTPCP